MHRAIALTLVVLLCGLAGGAGTGFTVTLNSPATPDSSEEIGGEAKFAEARSKRERLRISAKFSHVLGERAALASELWTIDSPPRGTHSLHRAACLALIRPHSLGAGICQRC